MHIFDDTKIVDISSNTPHIVREVICVKCTGGRAIAAYPEGTLLKQLECGNCGKCGWMIATGEYLDE